MPNPETTPNAPPKEKPLRGIFGGSAVPIGRLFGIRLGLDASWFIIFLLATWQLFDVMSGMVPEAAAWIPLGAGLFASLLFFLSILLHEMGHSLVSIRLGVPVDSITLFIFGGMAKISREPDRPRDEFLIAIAGPLVSVGLGAGLLLVALALPDQGPPLAVLTDQVFLYMGLVNLALAVFNMIPAFPLDGGRIFRAMLWAIFENFAKATRWAALIGSAFGWFLVISGILLMVMGGGSMLNGIWFAVMGWFLLNAARASSFHATLQESLGDVTALNGVDETLLKVPAAMSVAQLIEGPVREMGRAVFVVERGGLIVGTLTLDDLNTLPKEDWAYTSVQARCRPLDAAHVVDPEQNLYDTLKFMDKHRLNLVQVAKEGETLGFITRDKILAILRNRMQFFKKGVKPPN